MGLKLNNSLFVNRIYNSKNESLDFDGIKSVSESRTNVVTEATLINGITINDAIHRSPNVINISVMISDNATDRLGSIIELPSRVINSFGLQVVDSRSLTEYTKLTNWFNEKLTVTITTKYVRYENYTIQNMSTVQNEFDGLTISLSLKELMGVSSSVNTQTTLLNRLGMN